MTTKTKPHFYTPPAAHIAAMLAGRVGLIVQPCKKQPTLSFLNPAMAYAADGGIPASPFGQPGDVFGVRERWEVVAAWMDHKRPVSFVAHMKYHADAIGHSTHDAPTVELPIDKDTFQFLDHIRLTSSKWRSARSMPPWAIRIHYRTIAVELRPVQTITEAECIDTGTQYPVTEGGATLVRLTGKCPPCDYLRSIDIKTETYSHAELLRAHFASDFNQRHPGSWDRNDWAWFAKVESTKGTT